MAGAYEKLTFAQLGQWAGRTEAELASINYRPALKKCRVLIVADIKENFQGSHTPDGIPWKPLAHPRPNSKGSDKPLLDKGLLRASVTASGGKGHYETITRREMTFGTNLEYARVQQEGGTIRPRNAKNLAIPLTKEAVKAGSPRNWAEGFVKKGKNMAQRNMLTLIARPGKNPLLVEILSGKGKKGARWIAHYVLVKSVTIPARAFLGFGDKLIQGVSEILADFTQRQAGGLPPPGGE